MLWLHWRKRLVAIYFIIVCSWKIILAIFVSLSTRLCIIQNKKIVEHLKAFFSILLKEQIHSEYPTLQMAREEAGVVPVDTSVCCAVTAMALVVLFQFQIYIFVLFLMNRYLLVKMCSMVAVWTICFVSVFYRRHILYFFWI